MDLKKMALGDSDIEVVSGGVCTNPENQHMETPGSIELKIESKDKTSGSGSGIIVPETGTLIIEGEGTLKGKTAL